MKSIESSINTARLNWKPVVASFLLHMQERGFRAFAVNNGDGFVKTENNLFKTIDEATACDEASIRFHAPDNSFFTAYIVLGNEPCELVADFTCRETETSKAFTAAVEEWSDSMESMACPHEGMTAWHYLRMAQACMVAEGDTVPPQLAADVLAEM